MKIRRFFMAPEEIKGNHVRLSPEESHHLRDVLRLGPGEDVELFDGKGSVYRCRICRIESQVELEITESRVSQAESPLRLSLGQSLIKGDKLSWVIQKCTELGIDTIYPLVSRYSETGMRRRAAHEPDHRWRKIAVSAAAQCGRARTPIIQPVLELPEFCRQFSGRGGPTTFLPGMNIPQLPDLRLVVSEKGGLPARALSGFAAPASVLMVVGPEGGWSPDELILLKDSGFMELCFGSRILRSETAAVAAVTLAQFLWGDMGAP